MYQQYVASAHASANFVGNSNVQVMSFEKWVLSKYSRNAYSSLNVKEIVFVQGSQCQAIGARAFYNTTIESIVFPKSLTTIEEQAIGGCEKLSKIKFEDALNWKVIGNEDSNIDFADESKNVNIILEQYANYKFEKAE